ncbi:MAG: hypothetical protein VX913_13360 [Planctomycetota bacterium]|nr:hypothetical protein [Planctomycetota bacterium]MEE2713752.1 hypothetical protein [Planctomycetota bacterium]
MNGPALDARGNRVAAAWFTRGGGAPKVMFAVSSDGGQSFGKARQLPAKDPIGRCGVAVLADGSVAVCWLDLVNNVAELRASLDGEKIITCAKTSAGRASGVPEIVAEGKGALIAWRDVSKRRVLTARVVW